LGSHARATKNRSLIEKLLDETSLDKTSFDKTSLVEMSLVETSLDDELLQNVETAKNEATKRNDRPMKRTRTPVPIVERFNSLI
jgi:hypothetical protein